MKCPPPPKDLKRGFACEQGSLGEQSIQHACLFNIKTDPCEHHDLSQEPEHKATLKSLWAELGKFREIAVDSRINRSPDGPNCPKFVKCEGPQCNGMSGAHVPCNMP